MKMKKHAILALASIFALASCSEEKDASNTSTTNENSPLTALVLTEEPAEAIDIADLRKSAKPGDQVTFSGDILGAEKVLIDSRASMILGDPKKLTPCSPDEDCPFPWDVCCDDGDVIKASIVTVQAVDEAGKPIKEGFRGLAGIKELSSLVITGEVAKGSTDANMLINATGIFVKK